MDEGTHDELLERSERFRTFAEKGVTLKAFGPRVGLFQGFRPAPKGAGPPACAGALPIPHAVPTCSSRSHLVNRSNGTRIGLLCTCTPNKALDTETGPG